MTKQFPKYRRYYCINDIFKNPFPLNIQDTYSYLSHETDMSLLGYKLFQISVIKLTI